MVTRTAAQDGALQGMKEICTYMQKSESTVLRYIKTLDFPANKINGEWVSDVAMIVSWRRGLIAGAKKIGL